MITTVTLRILFTLAICQLAVASAWAKPRSMPVDTTLDQCAWAAEVTILAVDDAIRVRITDDADAIYRGHELLGKVVEVHPLAGGDASCRGDLQRFAGTRTQLLMVTGTDGRVQFVGDAKEVENEPGYHLRTWYDFNAAWLYSTDKEFGRAVGERFGGVYGVTKQEVATRFADERQQLMLTLAAILLRPRAKLNEAELQTTIAQLGDDAFFVREQAQRELLKLDASAADFLKEQAASASDLEIADRLQQIIRTLESPIERHAMAIRERGSEHEARLLIEAYDATDDTQIQSTIVSRLTTMAEEAAPELTADLTTPRAVVGYWRSALQKPKR